jgi:2-dehydro-3-deoxyphosphogluconate aldolase / (4S)-4-hydroxy-2-oxoglutarate aldolase
VSRSSDHFSVLDHLARTRVVPVANISDPDETEAIAGALIPAGLTCLEITFRTAAAPDAIRRARRIAGLLVGAGTVLSVEQAAAAAAAGAQFAVAPGTNPAVVERCRELRLPFFPGAATPSEIERARDLGARTVKLFPAAAIGGPAFVRAVSSVYPDMGFIPTGGIGPETVADYTRLSSVVACGGSWITAESLVRGRRFDRIGRLAKEAVAAAA